MVRLWFLDIFYHLETFKLGKLFFSPPQIQPNYISTYNFSVLRLNSKSLGKIFLPGKIIRFGMSGGRDVFFSYHSKLAFIVKNVSGRIFVYEILEEIEKTSIKY